MDERKNFISGDEPGDCNVTEDLPCDCNGPEPMPGLIRSGVFTRTGDTTATDARLPTGPPPAAEMIISVPDGYGELALVLKRAFEQAALGKGIDRHGTTRQFRTQPIMAIQDMVGTGFATGQAVKKIQESHRLIKPNAVHELLGAIVYCAAAVIQLEKPL